MLTTELERLIAHLRRLDRPVVPLLRPGVDAGQVLSALEVAEVPSSITEWFGWRNGVVAQPGQLQDDVNIIPAYNLISVEEAAHVSPTYMGDPVLGDYFVPLLTTASGDIYAAVWSGDLDEARVAGVLVGEPTEIEFSSIEQMVSTFNTCYDNGAFSLSEDGRLVMDSERYEETYAEVVTGE